MKKPRSFARSLLWTLLTFEGVSLLFALGWFFTILERSYRDEYLQHLHANQTRLRLEMRERLSSLTERVRTVSTDNGVRVNLMLGLSHRIDEIIATRYGPRHGMHVFVQEAQSGRIHPVGPGMNRPTLCEGVPMENFFALGARPTPFFCGTRTLLVATVPVKRQDELLGTVLGVYVFQEDGAFRRELETIGAGRIVRPYKAGFVDVCNGTSVEGDFVIPAELMKLPWWDVRGHGGRYVMAPLEDGRVLSVVYPLTVLQRKRAGLVSTLSVIVLVVLAGTLLVARIIIRRVCSPLDLLVREAGQLASAQEPRFIKTCVGYQEIQALAASFNRVLKSFWDLQGRIRQSAQRQVDASERRYRVLVETSPAGILTVDETGVILFANKAVCDITGYGSDELVSVPFLSLLSDVRLGERERLWNEIKSGRVASREFRLSNKAGREIWVELYAGPMMEEDRPARLLCMVDVTARKVTELERERLAIAIEQVPEAVFIADRKWTIQYVNAAFERMFGWKRAEVLGQPLDVLRSDAIDTQVYDQIRQTLSSGRPWKGMIPTRTRQGKSIEGEASATPIFDREGRIVNYVYIQRDVSRERELERQIRQSQKLQAIGTLAGGIAHDFNNILTAIMGNAQLALMYAKGDERVRERMERIFKGCERARDMIRQILTFSRREERAFGPFRLTEVVSEALELLRATLPATVQIQREFQVTEDLIRGDPTQIHQVIMNLGTNAAHALEGRVGVLRVKCREIASTGRGEPPHADLQPGRYVCLSVEDNGVGMDRHVLERVFDPFFTTKPRGQGTGLGLSVVHGIVTGHGGALAIESRPGEGTTVRVYLPLAQEAEEAARERSQAMPVNRMKVLGVDDEELVREMLREMLELEGHEASVVGSAEEVIEAAQGGGCTGLDVLLVDQTMPGMTGVELVKRLREMGVRAPAVICTGNTACLPKSRLEDLGIADVLQKPFTREDLLA
ncbi:PAS domain S-box-containing protein [Desulfacinum infernum DSM 9756]|uniref:histidine kinase n=1 Tax=Desulfacinum infernum DSM 9756 TaxID=1121391 RepID=A0A1M4TGG3_9BACT|nr:PAS domain-containing sensor histidine kinase [Desulfacinum infernum]SHE43488.1 PAS domain S-box-containing protein [Desulfacinum infernum DSM 9756]